MMQAVRALAAILAGCLSWAPGLGAEQLCPGDPPQLGCLKTNLEAMLEGQPERFWKGFEAHRAVAQRCEDLNRTAEFLDLAYFAKRNREAAARFGEAAEALAVENPACFLGGAARLRSASLRPLIEQLRSPRKAEPQAVRAALEPYRADPDFARALELYFQSE